ncbi:unnamed protein product [Rotaria socialis]|uniref:Cilia- and flagella-associated protein 99 n=4 Tax=Rotaria socialis TaxID=392032 RepID=A0A819XHC5_9BILA|nr:unnamed protein product [Rotaria socialis]CAF3394519.1 unnamed protein product [Rotaria socialis]CAF3443111.1 unnamed protein product [Rotaria socialis]CAF3455559.1 unnamed protein product [Rotaria socialis]CAF3769131.1 unnamed protein product [Rotaria socialis]
MERNANAYSELFYHCIQVLNEYDHSISEETFLEQYFQDNKVPNEAFVSTILLDCIRHSTLLKTVTDIFYATDGINIRKSEQNIYKIIAYLIFYQLDSVGFKLLRGFIDSVQLNRVHQFLKFLIDDEHLQAIQKECMKLYEQEYIDEKIGRVIKTYLPDLRAILLDLSDAVEGRTAPRPVPEPTKSKPFNLTAPKARMVPIPKIIPKIDKARTVPKTTYELPRDHVELEKIREDNHRRGLNKLDQTRALHHHFLQTDKSSKTQSKISKIMQEREKNYRFDHFRANPPPKPEANKIPVKLNIATILKESQLYKKQEDDVRRRLMDFEAGGKDAQEFTQWQQTMQKQDYDDQMTTIERKRLEGKMSYEEAILARQRLTEENRRLAEELKRQTREAIEEHVKEKVKDEQRMKQLIDEVVSGRENAKLSQQKLQQYKADFVKQYKEEHKQMMKQALEDAEAEIRQRAELIQQIRVLESVPIDRYKQVDLTSVAGHGVHDEMSIAELRERLEIVKLEREKERESRRDLIVKEKQTKEQMITHTVQNIVKYRNELTTQTAIKKQRQSSAPSNFTAKPEIEQLKQTIESKKAQRVSRQQQIRETLSTLSVASVSSTSRNTTFKPTTEWNRFDQLEKSYDKAQKRIAPSLIA